jgi:hypothetical protein
MVDEESRATSVLAVVLALGLGAPVGYMATTPRRIALPADNVRPPQLHS